MSMATMRRRVAAATIVYLGFFWAGATAAVEAVQTAPADLLGFPWAQAAVAVLITVGAGVTATFGRELAAQYHDRPFNRAKEYRKDIAVSVLLGVGGYAAGLMARADAPVVALGLIALGWSGTRALTAAADRVIDMIRRAPPEQEVPK